MRPSDPSIEFKVLCGPRDSLTPLSTLLDILMDKVSVLENSEYAIQNRNTWKLFYFQSKGSSIDRKLSRVPQSTQTYPKVPKRTQKYQTYPKVPKVPKSTQKCPKVRKSTQKYPTVPKSTLLSSRDSRFLPCALLSCLPV